MNFQAYLNYKNCNEHHQTTSKPHDLLDLQEPWTEVED